MKEEGKDWKGRESGHEGTGQKKKNRPRGNVSLGTRKHGGRKTSRSLSKDIVREREKLGNRAETYTLCEVQRVKMPGVDVNVSSKENPISSCSIRDPRTPQQNQNFPKRSQSVGGTILGGKTALKSDHSVRPTVPRQSLAEDGGGRAWEGGGGWGVRGRSAGQKKEGGGKSVRGRRKETGKKKRSWSGACQKRVGKKKRIIPEELRRRP